MMDMYGTANNMLVHPRNLGSLLIIEHIGMQNALSQLDIITASQRREAWKINNQIITYRPVILIPSPLTAYPFIVSIRTTISLIFFFLYIYLYKRQSQKHPKSTKESEQFSTITVHIYTQFIKIIRKKYIKRRIVILEAFVILSFIGHARPQ